MRMVMLYMSRSRPTAIPIIAPVLNGDDWEGLRAAVPVSPVLLGDMLVGEPLNRVDDVGEPAVVVSCLGKSGRIRTRMFVD